VYGVVCTVCMVLWGWSAWQRSADTRDETRPGHREEGESVGVQRQEGRAGAEGEAEQRVKR
jgi:hypothetical protein